MSCRIAILLLVLLAACDNTAEKSTQEYSSILTFGHGGSGFKPWLSALPMNTFESIVNAIDNEKADGVEVDVQLSSDTQLVVFHDEYLDRSTNCEGKVNSRSVDVIEACLYDCMVCSLVGKKFQVIKLEKVMAYFSNHPQRPYLTVDMKLNPDNDSNGAEYMDSFIAALIQITEQYNYRDKLLIESTSPEFLKMLVVNAPQFKLFYYPENFESGLAIAKELGIVGITINNSLISANQVKQAHECGLKVTIWGTGSKSSNADAISKGPDFIQTDNIPNLTSQLR